MGISIRNDRVKVIDITNANGEKIGEIKFNPHDKAALQKFWELRRLTAAGAKEHEQLVERYGALEDAEPDNYDKLGEQYEMGSRILNGAVDLIDTLTDGLDSIFGAGVCALFMQGYKDEEMLMPLIEAVTPFFEEAYKSQRDKVEGAKRPRNQN